MKKGKISKKKHTLSIIIVPNTSGKVKMYTVSPFRIKLLSLISLAVLILLAAGTGYQVNRIINENMALKNFNAQLYALNAEQKNLIEEKASEIKSLKELASAVNEKIDDYVDKYREITDKYIAGRIDSSKTSRSGERMVQSFAEDISELKDILKSLSELNDSEQAELFNLDEIEDKLKTYLDTIPTLWPASGKLSSTFGQRQDPIVGRRRFHEGIDIAASYGEDIKAAASGTVVLARNYSSYGRTVIINHGRGITTLYAHANKLLVKEGQKVNKGDVIAKVGSSGRSTGPHLHFEIRIDNEPVNPLDYLDK